LQQLFLFFQYLLLFRTKIYFDSINVDKIFKVDVDNKPDMTEINKIISNQDDEYLNHRIFLHIACIKKMGRIMMVKQNYLG
jgi:hypothetical protein